jgi:hypothetical protein
MDVSMLSDLRSANKLVYACLEHIRIHALRVEKVDV